MNDLGNLLQSILDLLKSWAGSFSDYATAVMEKLNLIEEDTDNLDDIKDNTDDIKDNTGAIITPVQSIQSTNTTIATNTTTIKNSVSAMSNQLTTISTNVGTASAYTEDIANNTLDCKNRLVTIGSDTTQIRTNSDSIASDVSEIKDTLGLYLYNTIVTEDSEGAIANFDTDLKDYLQNSVVTIPADAGGITGISIFSSGYNLFDEEMELGRFDTTTGDDVAVTTQLRTKNYIPIRSGLEYYFTGTSSPWVIFFDSDYNVVANPDITRVGTSVSGNSILLLQNNVFKINTSSICYMKFYFQSTYGTTYQNDTAFMFPKTETNYHSYNGTNYSLSFTTPITDGAEVDLLSGIVKINTSPVTYDSITPLAIRTFKGVNNIYSDIGDISVTYRETLKHYLEKQN